MMAKRVIVAANMLVMGIAVSMIRREARKRSRLQSGPDERGSSAISAAKLVQKAVRWRSNPAIVPIGIIFPPIGSTCFPLVFQCQLWYS